MNNDFSKDFQVFHNHVFGNPQYFYHNGLHHSVCTNLKATEREIAERLVLEALANSSDERLIIAAGHFRLQSAIPLLENLLSSENQVILNKTEVIFRALVKIQKDEKYLNLLVDMVVNKSGAIKGLTRNDAVVLLAEFREYTSAIDALLLALSDQETPVQQLARSALEKIFAGNVLILELLDHVKFLNSSHEERMEISKKIKEILNA